MAGEDPHTDASADIPHADRLVRTSSEYVCVVWMEANVINVHLMACKYSEWGDVVGAPEAGGLVTGAGEEVVAEGAPCYVPDRRFVGFVDYETRPCFERPKADGAIG